MGDSDPLHEMLEAYRCSALRAEEQSLADCGECPREEELVSFLRAGRLAQSRRESIAAHLLACPRCFDANLASAGRLERRRRWRRLIGGFLTAAAALLCWFMFFLPRGREQGPPETVEYIQILGLVDPHGLTLRAFEGADGSAQRILVSTDQRGHLSLARSIAGTLALEEVEAGAYSVAVDSGEEIALPLHAALPANAQAEWLVLLAPRLLNDTELRAAFERALASQALPAELRIVRYGGAR